MGWGGVVFYNQIHALSDVIFISNKKHLPLLQRQAPRDESMICGVIFSITKVRVTLIAIPTGRNSTPEVVYLI